MDDDDNLRVFDLVTGDVKELFPRRLLSETSLQADISADGQMIAYRIDASNNAFNRVVRLATNPFLATESRALNLFASDRVNDVSFSAEALPGSIAGVVYNDLA